MFNPDYKWGGLLLYRFVHPFKNRVIHPFTNVNRVMHPFTHALRVIHPFTDAPRVTHPFTDAPRVCTLSQTHLGFCTFSQIYRVMPHFKTTEVFYLTAFRVIGLSGKSQKKPFPF